MRLEDFTERLRDLLEEESCRTEDEVDPEVPRLESITQVQTYEERGFLGYDPGLTVKLKDGSEFHLTLTQRQEARDEE